MNNRESIEKREYEVLSPLACKAAESKGRVYDEEKCEYRTDLEMAPVSAFLVPGIT